MRVKNVFSWVQCIFSSYFLYIATQTPKQSFNKWAEQSRTSGTGAQIKKVAVDCTKRGQPHFPWAKSTAAVDYGWDVVCSLIKDKVGWEPKMVFALQSASVAKPLRGDAVSRNRSATEIYGLNDLL